METIIRQLTEQHPESVALLLKAYGYDAQPSVKNLTNLVKLHGDKPFVLSNATGEKKTLAEKILGGVSEISKAILVLKDGKSPLNKRVIVGPDGVYNDSNIEPTPRLFGINKTLFISLVALTVLAIAIILFKK